MSFLKSESVTQHAVDDFTHKLGFQSPNIALKMFRLYSGAWSNTHSTLIQHSFGDTSCCDRPLTGAPHLRFGPPQG